MVIEYQGEVVRQSVADLRERRSYDDLVGHGTYVFSLQGGSGRGPPGVGGWVGVGWGWGVGGVGGMAACLQGGPLVCLKPAWVSVCHP